MTTNRRHPVNLRPKGGKKLKLFAINDKCEVVPVEGPIAQYFWVKGSQLQQPEGRMLTLDIHLFEEERKANLAARLAIVKKKAALQQEISELELQHQTLTQRDREIEHGQAEVAQANASC